MQRLKRLQTKTQKTIKRVIEDKDDNLIIKIFRKWQIM